MPDMEAGRCLQALLILDMEVGWYIQPLLIRNFHLIRDARFLTPKHRATGRGCQANHQCNQERNLREAGIMERNQAEFLDFVSSNQSFLVLLLWSPRTHTVDNWVTLAVSVREVASLAAPWITIEDVDKTLLLQASISAQVMGNQ